METVQGKNGKTTLGKTSSIIIITITSLLVVIGVAAYLHISSPIATMIGIKNSITEHDWVKFEKNVDIDAFISSFLSEATKQADDDDDELASGLVQLFSGFVAGMAKEGIRKFIENPSSNDSSPTEFSSIFKGVIETNGFPKIIKEGKLAKVRIADNSKYADTCFYNYLVFRKNGINYRSIGVSGFAESEKEKEKIKKAYISFYNEPNVNILQKSLKIEPKKISKQCKDKGYFFCIEDEIIVENLIKNMTNKTIEEAFFSIKYDKYEKKFKLFHPLNAGQSINESSQLSYNMFMEEDNELLEFPIDKLIIEVNMIKFKDEDKIVIIDEPPVPEKPVPVSQIAKYL